MIARFFLLALIAWDVLARRRASAGSVAHAPRQGAPEREPETVDDLVGTGPTEAPAATPADPPRVMGYVLVCPGIGAVGQVGTGIPTCGRDGAAFISVAWERQVPVHVSDVLVLPSAESAAALLWTIRWAVPPTTEVQPVIVATGDR